MSSKKFTLPDKIYSDPQVRENAPEPEFFMEDKIETHRKARPPYILIAILIFIILSSFWKVFMVEKRRASEEGADNSVKQVPIERMIGGAK